MNIFADKKLYPLYFLIAIASVPLTFLYCLHRFFAINELDKLIDFAMLILQNLGQRSFKFDVYLAMFVSCIPPMLIFMALKTKKSHDTHGKAKWATKHDIVKTDFIPKKFYKDTLALFNPLNFTGGKYWKVFKRFLDFGMVTSTPMLDTNFDRGGFLLGKFKELGSSKKLYYDAPLAALIVAPPGAGKSTAVAIPNLLNLKTSCVVLDIKGELCDLTAGYRQKAFNNEVYIFNPLGNDNNLKFNPFDKKIVEKLDFNAKKRLVDEIANTIFVEEQGSDPHWIAKARELFTFYALYDLCTKNESNFFDIATGPVRDYKPLIEKESPYYKQLYEINEKTGEKVLNPDAVPEKLFYAQCGDQKYIDIKNPLNWKDESFDEIQQNRAKGIETLDEVVRNYARAWAGAADTEFSSIKSTFNRVMSVFASYQVRDATNEMSFEYEDLRRKNITLYIKIAQTDIDTLKSLIRVLLESIAKNLMINESKSPDERIYLILDEFIRFGKMPFLLEMPALCRSYGIVPLYITQSYGLIKKYYGEDDLKTMTDTIAFQILFKMNDADSAENVSKQIGKYTRENRSHSTKDGALVFGGTSSYSLEGTELITAQDILNIPNDEIIILVSGFKAKPIKLKAAPYYQEPELLKRLKWEFDPNNGHKPHTAPAKEPQEVKVETKAESAPATELTPAPAAAQEPAAIESAPAQPTPIEPIPQEPTQEELQAQRDADEARAIYEYEMQQKLQEEMKNASEEDLRRQIEALEAQSTKEYVYEVKDKEIDAKLQAPLKKSFMPSSVYKNIKADTKPLCSNGYSLVITDSLINEVLGQKRDANQGGENAAQA